MPESQPIIEGRNLSKHYPIRNSLGLPRGQIVSVDGVSLSLHQGETLALVGESGSGKSTLTRLLARLERPTAGELLLNGVSQPQKPPGSLREYSRDVQLVLQDPYASLNPGHTVGYTIGRALRIHGRDKGKPPEEAAVRLLRRVHIAGAGDVLAKYPHELSGGQRQRIAIARALAAEPSVLLADEPVSMLDVSIRLGLLSLLTEIKEQEDLALLYVTHDIATARYFSDRIMVLYAGRAVEQGSADQVIRDPQHPYTKMLVAAAPDPQRSNQSAVRILGEPPDMGHPPPGCRFHPRCSLAFAKCQQDVPPLLPIGEGRASACWLHNTQPSSSAAAETLPTSPMSDH